MDGSIDVSANTVSGSDNTVLGGGISFSGSSSLTAVGNTVTTTAGTNAFEFNSNALYLAQLTNNTASGTGANVIDLTGTLAASADWENVLPLAMLGGALVIPSGVTLTLEPGTVVKASGPGGFGFQCVYP